MLDVTKSQRVAALAVFFVVAMLACSMALGQQPGVGRMSVQPPGGVAFLDITKIFKSHARFNELMAELKADETKAEGHDEGRGRLRQPDDGRPQAGQAGH